MRSLKIRNRTVSYSFYKGKPHAPAFQVAGTFAIGGVQIFENFLLLLFQYGVTLVVQAYRNFFCKNTHKDIRDSTLNDTPSAVSAICCRRILKKHYL